MGLTSFAKGGIIYRLSQKQQTNRTLKIEQYNIIETNLLRAFASKSGAKLRLAKQAICLTRRICEAETACTDKVKQEI